MDGNQNANKNLVIAKDVFAASGRKAAFPLEVGGKLLIGKIEMQQYCQTFSLFSFRGRCGTKQLS